MNLRIWPYYKCILHRLPQAFIYNNMNIFYPFFTGSDQDAITECRTLDSYTMVFSYFLGSSLLFCFTMSFLFSLCMAGSPFLRDTIDREEYVQRQEQLRCFYSIKTKTITVVTTIKPSLKYESRVLQGVPKVFIHLK